MGWAGGSLSGYARPGGTRMCAANTVVLSKNELARRTGEKDQGWPRHRLAATCLDGGPVLGAVKLRDQRSWCQPPAAKGRDRQDPYVRVGRTADRRTRSRGSGAAGQSGLDPASVGTLDRSKVRPMAGQAARIINRSPVRSPSPAVRRPSGAPPAVRTVGGQADQPHGDVATSVGKINYPASTPMPSQDHHLGWTEEHSRGLADTHQDSSVPIETQMSSEMPPDEFAGVSECEIRELPGDAGASIEKRNHVCDGILPSRWNRVVPVSTTVQIGPTGRVGRGW